MKVTKFFALFLIYLVGGLVAFCILAMIIAQGIRWYKPYTDYSDGSIPKPFYFVMLIDNGNSLTTKRFDFYNRCGSGKYFYDVDLTNGGVKYLSASKENKYSSRLTSNGAMIISLYLGNDYYEYAVINNCVTPLREKIFDDKDGFVAGVSSFVVLLVFGLFKKMLKLRVRVDRN